MITLEAAQQILKGLGFDPGPADGISGPATQHSISQFQRAEGLLVTGALDEVTSQRLVVRAKEEGIGEGMPWWVWAGIVGGGSLIAWGIWRWASSAHAMKVESAKGRMQQVIEEYDRMQPLPRPLALQPAPRYPIALGPETEDIRHLTAEEILAVRPNPVPRGYDATIDPAPYQGAIARAKRDTIDQRLQRMGLLQDEPAAITPIAPPPESPPPEYAETIRDPEPVATIRDRAVLSGFGPKRASMQRLMEIDAEAQTRAYDRWARAMHTLGHESKFHEDYINNFEALAERARIDAPRGAYDAARAELIRAEVQRADPKAQARFRRLVDINRRALMKKDLGGV